MRERPFEAELIVVTGKGGVGKTTVAGALGLALARAGRRTLVLEVDPRESLHALFGTDPSGGAFVEAGTRLLLQNLRPADVLAAVVREQVGIEALARRIVESPVFRQVVAAVPGLEEVATLGHAHRLLRRLGTPDGPEVDTVVLDAPATGHGLALLEAPQLVEQAIRTGPFGRMAADLAAFVRDERRSAIVATTLAEELPVQETLEFAAALAERVGREPALLVVNGLYPEATGPEPPGGEKDPLLALWRRRRAINDAALGLLDRSWHGRRLDLPLVAAPAGPDLLEPLARALAAPFEGAA